VSSEADLPEVIGRYLSSRATFPGGVVDLQYQSGIAGDLISELVIAP
jgi:hypothetical protein